MIVSFSREAGHRQPLSSMSVPPVVSTAGSTLIRSLRKDCINGIVDSKLSAKLKFDPVVKNVAGYCKGSRLEIEGSRCLLSSEGPAQQVTVSNFDELSAAAKTLQSDSFHTVFKIFQATTSSDLRVFNNMYGGMHISPNLRDKTAWEIIIVSCEVDTLSISILLSKGRQICEDLMQAFPSLCGFPEPHFLCHKRIEFKPFLRVIGI